MGCLMKRAAILFFFSYKYLFAMEAPRDGSVDFIAGDQALQNIEHIVARFLEPRTALPVAGSEIPVDGYVSDEDGGEGPPQGPVKHPYINAVGAGVLMVAIIALALGSIPKRVRRRVWGEHLTMEKILASRGVYVFLTLAGVGCLLYGWGPRRDERAINGRMHDLEGRMDRWEVAWGNPQVMRRSFKIQFDSQRELWLNLQRQTATLRREWDRVKGEVAGRR